MYYRGKFSDPVKDLESIKNKNSKNVRHPLLGKILPLIKKGKDVTVEIGNDEENLVLFLPLISVKPAKIKTSGDVVVILPNEEYTRTLSKCFKESSQVLSDHGECVFLGLVNNIRKEAEELQKGPKSEACIIGDSVRLIDHIRRENIELSRINRCFIFFSENANLAGFVTDVLFIHSKLRKNVHTLIFTPEINDTIDELNGSLNHPHIIEKADWYNHQLRHYYYEVENQKEKFDQLPNIIWAENLKNSIIFCGSDSARYMVQKKLLKAALPSIFYENIKPAELIGNTSFTEKIVLARSGEEIRKLIGGFDSVLYFDPPSPEEYENCCSFLETPMGTASIYLLLNSNQSSKKEQIQETKAVNIQKNELPDQEKVIESTIKEILRKIKEEEDTHELTDFRNLIKKNVPLTLRAYFMAYLFKERMSGPSVAIQDYTTLFVSVGKNKKVYPKDLSQLFVSTGIIKRSDIGDIKILDNYSFIDINKPYAQKAIEKLDGKDFRGRKITVNYARRKE